MDDVVEELRQYILNNSSHITSNNSSIELKAFGEMIIAPKDTKFISSVLERAIIPILIKYADSKQYQLKEPGEQNIYPDSTLITKLNDYYAIDVKTALVDKKNKNIIKGMTLGTYKGYFKNRDSNKNISFPYKKYKKHIVIGIVYDWNDDNQIKIVSLFVQEKYKIAAKTKGSGNTENIGSIKKINELENGHGPFCNSESLFNEYWMNYNGSKSGK